MSSSSSSVIRMNNFAITHKTNPQLARVNPSNIGAIGGDIPISALSAGIVSIAPVTVNQIYHLPSFTQLLNQFGSNLDTGLPRAQVGDIFPLRVFNTGTQTAVIASNTGAFGGDGTAVFALATQSSTGTSQSAHATSLYVQLTSVNTGMLGSTGTYSLFQ